MKNKHFKTEKEERNFIETVKNMSDEEFDNYAYHYFGWDKKIEETNRQALLVSDNEMNSYYKKALSFIKNEEHISVSFLQRKMSISFPLGDRLMKLLIDRKIVKEKNKFDKYVVNKE